MEFFIHAEISTKKESEYKWSKSEQVVCATILIKDWDLN